VTHTSLAGKPLPRIDQLLSGAQLPALPQSAIRLLELSHDPDNGPAEFAVPIEADPGLTGQVLRFVNSSYFGFSREIASVKLAITLVGIRTIKNFALWSAIFSLMPNPKCGPFDLKCLWQDSLRRGLFARLLGRLLGLRDSEDLFAAALLQDMALPLLAKELPSDYNDLFLGRDGGRNRLSELEHGRFGWTHAQAAGVMARAWSLPEEFAALVEQHSQSTAGPRREGAPGPMVVRMSALLPSGQDTNWFERDSFMESLQQVANGRDANLAKLFAQVDEGFEEFAPVLKLARPARPLVECLQPEASNDS
jgi:HD-like signal output (HDOD) protein